MRVLNLTMEVASPEQLTLGLVDLPSEMRECLFALLTIDDAITLANRCADIAEIAVHNGLGGEFEDPVFFTALIGGGSPVMMKELEKALLDQGIEAVYSVFCH